MIQQTTIFLDTRQLTALFILKHHERMQDGILRLRALDDEGEAIDLPILKEWKAARTILNRFRAGTAAFFDGETTDLGKAWIESLPPVTGTPWQIEDDDYAQSIIRTRTCLIGVPGGYSMSGDAKLLMSTGCVNVIEHRDLCSEINPSQYSRVHLIVDVKRPAASIDEPEE